MKTTLTIRRSAAPAVRSVRPLHVGTTGCPKSRCVLVQRELECQRVRLGSCGSRLGMEVAARGAASPGGIELPITSIEDLLVAALEPGLRRHVADRAVQPHGIVVLDIPSRHAQAVLEGEGHARSKAFRFEGMVPAFELPIRLWIVRGGADVGHLRETYEFFEVSRDELRAVV